MELKYKIWPKNSFKICELTGKKKRNQASFFRQIKFQTRSTKHVLDNCFWSEHKSSVVKWKPDPNYTPDDRRSGNSVGINIWDSVPMPGVRSQLSPWGLQDAYLQCNGFTCLGHGFHPPLNPAAENTTCTLRTDTDSTESWDLAHKTRVVISAT